MNRFCADSQARLDVSLSSKTGKSRAFIQDEIKKGNVRVNDVPAKKPGHQIKPGDIVSYLFSETPKDSHLAPTPGPLDIIFEDEYLLAINKSAGVIVHPGAGQRENTLVHFILHYLNSVDFLTTDNERPGIVHRLDQGTTGVLLIAKDARTQSLLSNLFKNRTIVKTYHAITWGKMHLSGTIDSPIGRDRKDRKKMSSRTQKARTALTQWKTLERFEHFSHVALFPKTGRTHQLRVHLSENNFPIVGDPTYGRKKTKLSLIAEPIKLFLDQLDHTLLHAHSLEFNHPITGKPIAISAPAPQDFHLFLELLKKHDPCAL